MLQPLPWVFAVLQEGNYSELSPSRTPLGPTQAVHFKEHGCNLTLEIIV